MIEFSVRSSDGFHRYKVKFEGEGETLRARCSCPAGKTEKRLFCKHVAALLKGDGSAIIEPSGSLDDLKKISAGSPLLEKAKDYVPYFMRNMDKETYLMGEDIKSLADVGNYVDKLLSGRVYEKKYQGFGNVLEILDFEVTTDERDRIFGTLVTKSFGIINEARSNKPPYVCAGKRYSDIRAAGGKLVETICSKLNIENPLTEKIINPVKTVEPPKINYMEPFTYNGAAMSNVDDLYNYIKGIIKSDMLAVKEEKELRIHKAEYAKKDGKPKYTKKNTLLCMEYHEDENDASFTLITINNFIRFRFFNKAGLRFINEAEKLVSEQS